jgi:hypothetical protein
MSVHTLYTCDFVQFGNLVIHYVGVHYVIQREIFQFILKLAVYMHTVNLLVHLTDRTVPTVRLCCQSSVQWFVVTRKCLRLYRDTTLAQVLTILILIHLLVTAEHNVLFE